MSVQAEQEQYRFQAEVVQIQDLMAHSPYSDKEIFLRELIPKPWLTEGWS